MGERIQTLSDQDLKSLHHEIELGVSEADAARSLIREELARRGIDLILSNPSGVYDATIDLDTMPPGPADAPQVWASNV